MLRDPLVICQLGGRWDKKGRGRRESEHGEGDDGINYYCSGKSGQSRGWTMRSDDRSGTIEMHGSVLIHRDRRSI